MWKAQFLKNRVLGKLDHHLQKKKKEFESLFYNIQNITSKWTEDINIRPKAMKHLEESKKGKLLYIGLGNDLFNMIPTA